MLTSLFDYHLPAEKIAQHPLEPRDSSKLLRVMNNGVEFEEMIFRDIVQLFHSGDVLVINDTKVMPARICGYTILKNGEKKDVECLFLRNTSPDIWEIMCFPAERLKIGRKIILENNITLDIVGETYVGRLVRVPAMHHEWLEVLQKYGEVPLPPYITEHLANSELYQTVYAEHLGSTASPTAGRHFTPELLQKIQDIGVKIAHITLHIGPGTFKPIYEENIDEYQIHSEYVTMPAMTVEILEKARKEGNRIIAVGTTSMRSLESYASGKLSSIQNKKHFSVIPGEGGETVGDPESRSILPQSGPGGVLGMDSTSRSQAHLAGMTGYSGDTNLYITPGYTFQMVDVLITNFHAPRTSLLVLVAAFVGYERMMQAYQYALGHNFRFLSFGDAMWIEKT